MLDRTQEFKAFTMCTHYTLLIYRCGLSWAIMVTKCKECGIFSFFFTHYNDFTHAKEWAAPGMIHCAAAHLVGSAILISPNHADGRWLLETLLHRSWKVWRKISESWFRSWIHWGNYWWAWFLGIFRLFEGTGSSRVAKETHPPLLLCLAFYKRILEIMLTSHI